jgi:hypothetical protein
MPLIYRIICWQTQIFSNTIRKLKKTTEKIKWKNYHRCGRLAERTREKFVVNIVGLSNERRRCFSKEHVWRDCNGKNDRIEVLAQYEDQNNKWKQKFRSWGWGSAFLHVDDKTA